MEHFPEKLGRDTIIEALFELRFSSANESVADILPGILYQAISDEFPKIERLGVTQLPPSVLQSDENFRYSPHFKLTGEHYYIQTGKHVFSIGCPRPYSGWPEFSAKIHKLVNLLRETKLIDNVERFSIKYTNIIPEVGDYTLDQLKVNLEAGAFNLGNLPTHIRSEVIQEGFLNIVQISSRVTAALREGDVIEGILLDIDTISLEHDLSDFWSVYAELLDKAHDVEKMIFFGMLKEETKEKLEPQRRGS